MVAVTKEQIEKAEEYSKSVKKNPNSRRSIQKQIDDHRLGKLGEFWFWNHLDDPSIPEPDCSIHSKKFHGLDVGNAHVKTVRAPEECRKGWLINKGAVPLWKDDEQIVFIIYDEFTNEGKIRLQESISEFKKRDALEEPIRPWLRETHHAVYTWTIQERKK